MEYWTLASITALCVFVLWLNRRYPLKKEETDELNDPLSISRLYILRTNFVMDADKRRQVTQDVKLWKKYGIDVIVLEPGMEFQPFQPNLEMQRYMDTTSALKWEDVEDVAAPPSPDRPSA